MSDLSDIFNGEFNPSNIPAQKDFDVLPPGKYTVQIEKAEVKKTNTTSKSAGDGHYISLCLSIIDEKYQNRKLFDNINIQNPNQLCVEIGLRQLASLGQAIGLTAITDTDQLIGRSCIAHVKTKGNKNSIRAYSAIVFDPPPSTPVFEYPNIAHPVETPNYIDTSNTQISNKPPWMR